MLECSTFLLLKKRFRDVFYWRDRGEVDFVVLRKSYERGVPELAPGA